VEARGVEPLSEIALKGTSPGAAAVFKFPLSSSSAAILNEEVAFNTQRDSKALVRRELSLTCPERKVCR